MTRAEQQAQSDRDWGNLRDSTRPGFAAGIWVGVVLMAPVVLLFWADGCLSYLFE